MASNYKKWEKEFRLNQLVREFTTDDIDISSQRILDLQNVRAAFEAKFKYIEFNHFSKLQNRFELSEFNYQLVSIGEDCLPRTIATRWGLKRTRLEGETTCPFDLAVHKIQSVRKVLEDDFRVYVDREYFQISDKKVPFHKFYKITFNHEKANNFVTDNFRLLREKYSKRIDNFFHQLSQNQCRILFLLHIEDIAITRSFENVLDDFISIKKKIGDICSISPYFLVIDTRVCSDKRDFSTYLGDHKNVEYMRIPKPRKSYVWYDPEYFSSSEGVSFEMEIASKIKEIILSKFKNNLNPSDKYA